MVHMRSEVCFLNGRLCSYFCQPIVSRLGGGAKDWTAQSMVSTDPCTTILPDYIFSSAETFFLHVIHIITCEKKFQHF